MASLRRAEAVWIAGVALLVGSGIVLAASGTELVAAAGWLEDRGRTVPGWLLGIFGRGIGLEPALFYAFSWVLMTGYVTVAWVAPRIGVRAIELVAALMIAIFLLAPPLLSQDVFSYIAYARMAVEHGVNPYEAGPDAIAPDPVSALVGWPDAPSVYGPVFTLATFPLAPLGLSASLWVMKVAVAATVLGTALLSGRLAAQRGLDRGRVVALVALNPLVLVHVVGGAHNDAFVGLAVASGIGLVLSAREASGAAAIVAGAAVKISGLFLAPFAFLGAYRKRRFLGGAIVSIAAVALVAAVAFGGHAAESISLVDSNQSTTSRYSIPATLSRIAGIDVDLIRTVALVLFAAAVVWLLVRTWKGADWVWAAAWAGMAMLLATGWLLPWYLIWVLPAVALSRDGRLIGLTLAFTAFQLINRVPL